MTFDFTKEYKELYVPKTKPALVEAPAMTFIAVAGEGDPNDENGAYAQAVGLLYALSYTIRMAKNGDWQPDGYFEYKVAPLEGLWWTASGGFDGRRITDKSKLQWVSLIRQPDFVTTETFAWRAKRQPRKNRGWTPCKLAWSASPKAPARRFCIAALTTTSRPPSQPCPPS